MVKKLFIGNLPFTADDAQLTTLFGQHGTVVSANVVIDKFTKRSKGFGFVEFATEEEAAKALQAFDQYELDGRKISVKEALPRPERPVEAPQA